MNMHKHQEVRDVTDARSPIPQKSLQTAQCNVNKISHDERNYQLRTGELSGTSPLGHHICLVPRIMIHMSTHLQKIQES